MYDDSNITALPFKVGYSPLVDLKFLERYLNNVYMIYDLQKKVSIKHFLHFSYIVAI